MHVNTMLYYLTEQNIFSYNSLLIELVYVLVQLNSLNKYSYKISNIYIYKKITVQFGY